MTICEKNRCYGCSLCKAICPQDAISMVEDNEGFLVPTIDKSRCIRCGMCIKCCKNKIEEQKDIEVYAAKTKDKQILLNSSSGGMFTALSDQILNKKGKIYGSIFNSKTQKVQHIGTDEKQIRDAMRGSKYVQSDIQNCFKEIKKDLDSGKYVLFVGTPCQVNAVKKYVEIYRIETNKLFLCDLICHGVPSPKILKDQLDYIKTHKRKYVDALDFKNKEISWKFPKAYAYAQKKKISLLSYTQLFYSNFGLRKTCYECEFCNLNRVGDITIGDYWGIEKFYPEIYDKNGVSLLMVNTIQGKKIFQEIEKNIIFKQTTKDTCLQPNLERPTKKPEKREEFWEDYNKMPYKNILKKYGNDRITFKTTQQIKNIVKKILKK